MTEVCVPGSLLIPGRGRLPEEFVKIGLPAVLLHIDPTCDNSDVVHHKPFRLFHKRRRILVESDSARSLQHPMPGHIVIIGQVAQCMANLARATRIARDFGDLAITRDATLRDITDRVPDAVHTRNTIHYICSSAQFCIFAASMDKGIGPSLSTCV